jgi:hypothetical protein
LALKMRLELENSWREKLCLEISLPSAFVLDEGSLMMTSHYSSRVAWLVTTSVILCSSAPGLLAAQEKCKMKWEVSAANSNYTQQHVIDVGDVPGHQVRIYELHRTFPNDQPNCEGLKRVEEWSRGYSDYIDRNGRAWGYRVTVFENGDKIFGEISVTTQTATAADGSKKTSSSGVIVYTGGTGKYQGVRGLQRENSQFDPEKNFNQSQSEAEYWIEK